jgi:hypothetical protein
MIKFIVFVVIESGFIFTVIRVHQFSPVQVDAMKQLLALSLSQVRALYTVWKEILAARFLKGKVNCQGGR